MPSNQLACCVKIDSARQASVNTVEGSYRLYLEVGRLAWLYLPRGLDQRFGELGWGLSQDELQ